MKITTVFPARYASFLLILALLLPACRKEPHRAEVQPAPIFDTIFTIEDQAPPVKISFNPGTWIAVQFHSDVQESRCPNCFATGRAACPYLGSAYAYFQVMTSAGDSVYFSSEFPSCVAALDTAATIYGAPAYLPLKGYTVWNTALLPYPLDSSGSILHYYMQFLVQYQKPD